MTPDDSEIMRILESLVADNEALKRDNAELQGMLAETREDVLSLREEVDEQRASTTPLDEGFYYPIIYLFWHCSDHVSLSA